MTAKEYEEMRYRLRDAISSAYRDNELGGKYYKAHNHGVDHAQERADKWLESEKPTLLKLKEQQIEKDKFMDEVMRLYDAFKNPTDCGESWWLVDSHVMHTDTGYAREGIEQFVAVLRERMGYGFDYRDR